MTHMSSPAQIALVTGATSGIGKAIAARLAADGFVVYGTGRNPDGQSQSFPEKVTYLQVDVRNETSVKAAVDAIIGKEGRLDVLVACAGMGIAGSVEDTTIAEAAMQMDVNFLGTVRTVKACLAPMRLQKAGKIIIIGSLAGRIGMPFQAFYSSSKFALEGFVESIRHEMRKFNVWICIVEPGDFRTGFTGARKKVASRSGAYDEVFAKVIGIQEHDEQHGASPEAAADKISRLVRRNSLPLRVVVGPAFQKVAAFMKRIIPAAWFEFFYRVYYRIS